MPFIILDRDGVINYDSDEYIKSPEEWLPIPGSLAAIALLNQFNFRVLVATNQSGIARGYYDVNMLNKIHAKLNHELANNGGIIEEIFFCPHHPDDQCECRKPKPGMLYQIAEKYTVNLAETFFVGDSFVDVQAAQTAGCLPLLVRTGKWQLSISQHPIMLNTPNFANLAEAVTYVLAKR